MLCVLGLEVEAGIGNVYHIIARSLYRVERTVRATSPSARARRHGRRTILGWWFEESR